MNYKCEGPGCVYTTLDQHQIHKHHIVPKSKGGSNTKMNLVRLCPNCHNKIYIPGCNRGIHSIKAKNHIILHSIMASSIGLVLEYEENDIIKYTQLDTWRNSNTDKLVSGE